MFSTRFLRHAVLLGALLLLISQIVATALMVNRAKDAQITAAIDSLNKIGRSTEAAINRSFVQVDAMLAGLPAVLAPFQRDGRLEVSQVNRVLRELNNQNFTYRDILLIGADGLPVATALPVSRRRRLSLPSASSFAEVAARGGSVLIGGPVLNANTGEFYDGRSTEVSGSLRVRHAPYLLATLDLARTAVSLPGGRFTANTVRLRSDYAFSPRLNATIFAQWDNQSSRASANARVRWTVKPGSDLYVVWNSNWPTGLDRSIRWLRPSRGGLVAKYVYFFRG